MDGFDVLSGQLRTGRLASAQAVPTSPRSGPSAPFRAGMAAERSPPYIQAPQPSAAVHTRRQPDDCATPRALRPHRGRSSMSVQDPSAPPSRQLLMLEARAIPELAAFFSMAPLLRLAPAGDGHPVLVLPGLSASDVSTRPLRAFLKDRGYRAHGWKLGRNLGPRPGVEAQMQERLAELHARYQRKVSLVGWSLGG